MKANLISLVAGSLCLPATYTLTRHGSIEISIAAIITIAALSTWLTLWYVNRDNGHASWWSLGIAFAVGAVVSEAVSFAYYYFDYGQADEKLSVGVAVSIIEGGVIALLGAATVIATFFALRRITTRSRLDAQ